MSEGEKTKRIETRFGIEVYRNAGGTISIHQLDSWDDEDSAIVVVHPDDVEKLVAALREQRREMATE